MDGKELYNSPDPLDVKTVLELNVNLMSGNHVFEGFGSGSGDKRGKWSFSVNDQDVRIVKTDDLNLFG